ncbi:MAG: response regulator [Bacteroidetes bacterium]|nr:response regulator [Bacteroidota bacterium]
MGNAIVEEVMLIDDEPIDLFINEKLLTAYGFSKKYVSFQDARQALNELEKRAESGKAFPGIIFLDYFMPLVDGFDFLVKLKEIEARTPESFRSTNVIMLTTMKAPEKRKKLEEFERILTVMNKPLTEKAVAELGKLLGQKGLN